jgi:DNA topoisomerase-1
LNILGGLARYSTGQTFLVSADYRLDVTFDANNMPTLSDPKSAQPTVSLEETNKKLVDKGRRAKWWRRRGTMKRGFEYFTHDGKKLTDEATLERIRSLVIPPAWQHVRISPASGGKLQAVGIDTSGRLQYIYHPKFAERQQRKKFARIEKFAEHMPQLRRITNEHIMLDGFPKEKVLAIMTRLINSLYIRMGTDQSVKRFRTYGITTLGNKHINFGRGGKVIFDFVGKSHIQHRKVLVDPELAVLLREVVKIGRGRKLFQYIDENGKAQPVKPSQINGYIKSITAPEFSAKDFRTWGATMLAAVKLAEIGYCDDERQIKKNIVQAVKAVAEELGNTPTVCRSSYIHPTILSAYSRGVVITSFTPRRLRSAKRIQLEFEPEEAALLELFKQFH